jgi:hypothetical protein
MEIDRRLFIASLGGASAVAVMDTETRAESLEDYMSGMLDQAQQPQKFATVAELDGQIETRAYRRGAGSIFIAGMGYVVALEAVEALKAVGARSPSASRRGRSMKG